MRDETIIRVSRDLTALLYDDMTDKENQGPLFTWSEFPEMAARRARATIFMYLESSPTEEEKTLCYDTARGFAEKLIEPLIGEK